MSSSHEFPTLGAVTDSTLSPSTRSFEPDETGVMTVPSLCMGCGETGATKLLLTRIPFFRDVILMAFDCEACGLRNSEVQSAEVQERGARFEVTVTSAADLNRQLVKGDRATARVPELDLEIPPATQKGVFTTIEGMLSTAAAALLDSQPVRRAISAADADSVEEFCARLTAAHTGASFPFTFVLDDPSGNSFVENPFAPRADPRMRVRHYVRTQEQCAMLGLNAENARDGGAADYDVVGGSGGGGAIAEGAGEDEDVAEDDGSGMVGSAAVAVHRNRAVDLAGLTDAAAARLRGEAAAARQRSGGAAGGATAAPRDLSGNVPSAFKKGGALISATTERADVTDRARAGVTYGTDGKIAGLMFDSSTSESAAEAMRFPVPCHNCSAMGECLMCCTDVPHFKEVILMGFVCDECGWKNVEVKGGGAVPPLGTVTTLRFTPGEEWSAEDLGRDVIKGDTASVEILELDLELAQGSLGGLYTTVEVSRRRVSGTRECTHCSC